MLVTPSWADNHDAAKAMNRAAMTKTKTRNIMSAQPHQTANDQ